MSTEDLLSDFHASREILRELMRRHRLPTVVIALNVFGPTGERAVRMSIGRRQPPTSETPA